MARALRLLLLLGLVSFAAGGSTAAGAGPTPAHPAAVARPPARLVVRTGQSAPGGGIFTEFSDPALNGHGDLLFGAVVNGAQVKETLYLRTSGGLRRIVSTGDPAPTGGVFRAFSDLLLNDRGTVGFLGRTTSEAAPEGLYLVQDGVVTPIAAVGQAAPSGGTFTDFANPTINNSGVVAFVGRTSGAGGEGIFTNSEGATTPALMAGAAAPTGGAFEFFLDGTPALNDRGRMALVAATTEHHTQGVFVLAGGRTLPIVTTEDESLAGGRFAEFGSVVITNAGTVGFIGRTPHGPIREALYVTGRAVLLPVVRSGEPAGGSPLTTFAALAMNEREDMVFELSNPIIPRAIYLATRGAVRPIVRAGDPAPGGGTFTAFSTPALNAPGQVAFVAETADGRHGVYVAVLP